MNEAIMKVRDSSFAGEGRCSGERIRWDKVVKCLLTLRAENIYKSNKKEVRIDYRFFESCGRLRKREKTGSKKLGILAGRS